MSSLAKGRMVEIVEVSPRDGLQNESVSVSARDKAELVLRAVAAGARRVEAVSFVNPRAVPQMADAAEVMAILRGEADLKSEGVRLIGLVLNMRGLGRAVEAGVDEANFVVVASETFNRRNQGVPIAETMAQIGQAVEAAAAEGLGFGVTIGATFGCPFEGEVEPARVHALVRDLAAMGVREIALADTIGVADPLAVETMVAAAMAEAPQTRIRCHFHNTRNTGLANAYAALRAGVDSLDASIGGIGGCPFAPAATGNIPTEDLAYMIQRMGLETGYDLGRLIETARWLGGRLGDRTLPGMLAKAGTFPGQLVAA